MTGTPHYKILITTGNIVTHSGKSGHFNQVIKVDTGSALDTICGLSSKIQVVYEPTILQFPEQTGYTLFLPHMKIKHLPYYNGRETYGKEEFYQQYFSNWETYKPKIEFISAHLGDETCGELLQDADLSLFSCMKSNGHIHKTVSKNQLESAAVTRRDEVDKKCIMRKFDTKDFSKFEEIELPLFLNYAKIEYGASLDDYFKNPIHKKPETSLIVDIYGHDNEDFARAEYVKKFEGSENPKIYVGEIVAEERLLDIMLPKITGLEVCQQIREFSSVPIIMLTAKGEDMDKILGLEYGADDYITKPFNILEVKARIKAIMRRTQKEEKVETTSFSW